MRLSALAAALLGAAVATIATTAPPTVSQIFTQSEPASVYTAVGISRHAIADDGVTFAVADGLNAPQFVEIYNSSSLVWSFNTGSGTYLVDSARHVEGSAVGTVDTFAAYIADGNTGTTLYGLASGAQSTSTPLWTLNLPGCLTDTGGGTYTGIEVSDSGSSVAFMCHYTPSAGGASTARVYLIDGQKGKTLWYNDLGPSIQAGQGQVQITGDGSWVLFVNEQGKPTPNTAMAYILEGKTGVLRDNITIPFFITAAISDSGDYVVVGDESVAHVWAWDASTSAYAPSFDVTPPANPTGMGWIPWDIQMTTGSDADELVILGCISGNVLQVQISVWSAATQALTTNWLTAPNPKLQENPTMRADGAYIGVSLWGNEGDVPTVVLLKSGSNSSIFNYTSPGSMFAVDIAVDSTSNSVDNVYLAAAGKAVPANEFGNGGNAYGWSIVVPK